jgi:signal transduction histidine kinase/CheY-like chemotaxis protein
MTGSPLHGILGAAEFLAETASDAYQSGLVTSIVTCGRTLLDTLNHVLDYSKINKLGRAQMRRHAKQNKLITLSDSSLESLSMTGEFDLGVLVEEVAEAVSAGHAFKKMPVNGSVMTNQTEGNNATGPMSRHDSFTAGVAQAHGEGGVSVLLDVSPRQSWRVRTQPGALRRIIMNLLGNSLKYTTSGFVAVSLRAHENANSSRTSCVIRIVDSGKGMSDTFQHDRMFVPFSQEDPFQPGTGLGLSIVKSIVDSLGGTMEVKSQVGVGTSIDVHLSLPPATDQISNAPEDELTVLGRKTLNKHLVLLEPDPPRVSTHHISRLEETIRETCRTWFGMRVSKSKFMDKEDADIYLYSEPPSLEKLVERHRQAAKGLVPKRKTPIIVVYMSAEDAIATSRDQQKILTELGSIVEVIPQPCGPRKLAKILNICLQRAEELKNATPNDCENPEPLPTEPQQNPSTPEPKHPEALEPASGNADDLVKSMSAAVSYPSPPPFDPATPSLQPLVVPVPQPPSTAPNTAHLHALIVDDNQINRQLLVMFMKKHKYSYVEAADGQEALDAYKASCLPGPHSDAPTRRFDVVLMDISMPVMDGMESTRRIREFEKENGLTKSNVIALTGLASAQAQQEAEASGIDVFMPKPVKFAELKKLLTVKKTEGDK